MQIEKRWSRASKEEAGNLLVSTVEKYARDQSGRLKLAAKRLGVYLARNCESSRPSLSTETYDREPNPVEQMPLRIGQSVIDTAKAKIASRQRPKGQVLTKGGDYRDRLKARELSKFCEGVLYQQQGCFETTWELGDQVFKDAEIWEAGVIMVTPDVVGERIAHERFFAHNMFFDPLESKAGSARHLCVRYPASKLGLAEQFPEMAGDIMTAELIADDKEGAAAIEREDDMCSLFRGWFLGHGKKYPGRTVSAIKCRGGVKVLIDTEWDWPRFPFAFVIWERNQFGAWGTPAVDQIADPQTVANDIYSRMEMSVRTHAQGHIDVERGALDDATLQKHNEFTVRERAPGSAPPTVTMPPPFNPATFQFFQYALSACYEIPGVSEMSAQGRKEPGVESGVAIRTVNDLQDQRFLPKSRAQENLYVQLAMLDMYAARDLRKSNVKVTAARGYGEYLEELVWDDIEPKDLDRFTVQASSSAEDTLAGRRQFITDYAAAGYITPEMAEVMLSTPNPDVESMNKREQAQYRYLERVIARFQYADEETWDPATDAIAPDELLTKPTAYVQMVDAYLEMLGSEFPEFNLELMRTYIALLSEMMAPAAPPAGATGPAMPPGGGGQPMMDPAAMAPDMMTPPMGTEPGMAA